MNRSRIGVRLSLAVALAVWSAAAAAQGPGPRGSGYGPGMMSQGYGPGMGPGMMMGPDMMRGSRYRGLCNPRMAGFAEWRFDRIESAVKPSEAQKKALEELKAASAKAAETIAAACPAEIPADSAARLAAMEKRMESMLQAVKIVRPAYDAFYGLLDREQKAQLDAVGPRRWRWPHWRWREG